MIDVSEMGLIPDKNTIISDRVQLDMIPEDNLQCVEFSETNKFIGDKNSAEDHHCINRIIKKMKNFLCHSNKTHLLWIAMVLCILALLYLTASTRPKPIHSSIDRNSLWYQNEIIYEINVPMYRDSNGDGIGDLQGILEKLDYLEKNNIQTILLQSSIFNVSNELFELSDRQYATIRTTNLLNLDPQIGTEDDFIEILANKNIHIIIDLPLSSTSDHKDFTWYGFNTSSSIKIENPCQYDKSDLGCKYYQIYKQLPLDFSNKEIADTAESRLRYWLFEKNINGIRVDLPLAFDRTTNTYQISLNIINQWKSIIEDNAKQTTPKLLLFDIPFHLQQVINNQSLLNDLMFSTALKHLSQMKYEFNSTDNIPRQRFWQTGFSREHFRLGMVHNISQRIIHTLGMLIGGTPIVLYGDEFGLKQRKDPWMVWTSDPPYGEFSSCLTEKCNDILSSYDDAFLQTNVQSQETITDLDNESLLLFFRRLSKLRQHISFRNGVLKIDYESKQDILWFIREATGHRGFLIVIHADRHKEEPIHISLQNLTNYQIPNRVYYEYRSPNVDLLPLNSLPMDSNNMMIFPGSIHIFWWPLKLI